MSDMPPADPSASGPGSSGLAGIETGAAQASASLAALAQPAQAAASAIDQAFSKAGASLASTLAKAASDGKLSLGELASAVISAVDSFSRTSAGTALTGSLTSALTSAISGVFGGARADGGPVSAGGAYLVGERGPEVFRPAGSGEIAPAGAAGGTTVNVTVQGGGAPALGRSEAQIASALARAVALGARR